MPECAHYDKNLTYRLRPGHCLFYGREFESIDISINSLGVRDDEASLLVPEIIVVGDSFAMGWGVQQSETFAQLIEDQTGLRVLNAAVASYGTVREMAILKDVDKSTLRYLIVQYCDNDYRENKTYFAHDSNLPIRSEATYLSLVEEHLQSRSYYYGKHTLGLLESSARSIGRDIVDVLVPRGEPADEVEVFVNALVNSTLEFSQITLIVFEVNSYALNDSKFIGRLRQELRVSKQRSMADSTVVIDLSDSLSDETYFRLDDHINAAGHKVIAEELMIAMAF